MIVSNLMCFHLPFPSLSSLFSLPSLPRSLLLDIARAYIPCVYALNKIDSITLEELQILTKIPHYAPISSHREWGLRELLSKCWDYCLMLRVYTKPKGAIPDYNEPVILHDKAPTVLAFCDRLHRSIKTQFKYAWVWGSSVKHQPQRVGLDHILCDEDVVQIVKR